MARTIIEELLIQVGLDFDERSVRQAIRTYTDFRFVAGDLVRALRAVGDAVLSPVKDLIDLGNETALTATRLGTTTEGLQDLRNEATLMGVSTEQLTRGLEFLGRAAYTASVSVSSSAAKAFSRLGVHIYETNGHLKTSDKLFSEVTDKISRLEDPAKASGIAIALMGRGGGALLPFLKQGPEYLEALREETRLTGNVMKDDLVQGARETSLWMQILGMHVDGVKKRIGADLLPVAFGIIGTLYQWKRANSDLINQRIDKYLGIVSDVVFGFLGGLRSLGKAVDDIASLFGGWDNVIALISAGLGAGFLALVGKATLSMLRFAASLALAGIGPLIFGALLAALFLVVQDLESVDSLLKKIYEFKVNGNDNPAVRVLYAIVNAARAAKDAVEELWDVMQRVYSLTPVGIAGRVTAGGYKLFNSEVEEAKRTAFLQHLQGIADDPNYAQGEFPLGRAFDAASGNTINDVDVTINIAGNADGPTVANAAREGTQQALRDATDRRAAQLREAQRQTMGRGGPR